MADAPERPDETWTGYAPLPPPPDAGVCSFCGERQAADRLVVMSGDGTAGICEDCNATHARFFARRRQPPGLHRTIPALPVRHVPAAVAYYRDHFGFEAPHATGDFAVVVRDEAVLHLWGAGDEDWRSRADLDRRPIRSGAESFLAGTASCRIEVAEVDALFAELEAAGVLHDVSRAGVTATDFGTREFSTLDRDGNLLTFFRWNDG